VVSHGGAPILLPCHRGSVRGVRAEDAPGAQLHNVTVNTHAERVAFADSSGERRSISLGLAGAVLVRL